MLYINSISNVADLVTLLLQSKFALTVILKVSSFEFYTCKQDEKS